MEISMTTTAFEINGHQVTKNLGVVRGITVRSRSIFGTIGGSLQTLVGGNITLFTELCEKTRAEAFDMMVAHAEEVGANAVIGIRYDATEVMGGVTGVVLWHCGDRKARTILASIFKRNPKNGSMHFSGEASVFMTDAIHALISDDSEK